VFLLDNIGSLNTLSNISYSFLFRLWSILLSSVYLWLNFGDLCLWWSDCTGVWSLLLSDSLDCSFDCRDLGGDCGQFFFVVLNFGVIIKGDIGGTSTTTTGGQTDISTQIIEKQEIATKLREEATKIKEVAISQTEELEETITIVKKQVEETTK
jgi:hypothetical protein